MSANAERAWQAMYRFAEYRQLENHRRIQQACHDSVAADENYGVLVEYDVLGIARPILTPAVFYGRIATR